MSFLRTYRPQPKWRPRQQFANAKPRVGRGNRKGVSSCSKHRPKRRLSQGKIVAAARQTPGRPFNRLPEWTDPRSKITRDGRHRLKGEDYQRLRGWAAERAANYCECGCERLALIEYRRPHPLGGEVSHNEHGAKKSDELHRVKWKNWQCHEREHSGFDKAKKKVA